MILRFDRLDDRACPTTLPAGFSESLVSGGLSGPTALALAPDGRIFVAEQTGTLRVVENGSLLPSPFLSLTVESTGERGLLGVAFDPQFATSPFVYVYYTVPGASGGAPHNRISRVTANGNLAVPGSEQILVDLEALGATNHNGGAIHFGADGMLYVGVGENAVTSNAQSLANRLGKILRYNPDGTIPADNPTTFDGIAGTTTGANRAIWAVGLRNPFTFGVQPGTGRLFLNDVGQNAFEEIDDGAAGRNYGWPATEGDFAAASFPQFTRPVYAYPHGAGNFSGFAIVGGAFYNPATATFPADFAGDYFFGDLVNGYINRLDPNTLAVENFATNLTVGSLVGVEVTPQGDLLYLARGSGGPSGAVYRIAADLPPPPLPPGPAPILAGPGTGSAPVVKLFDRLTAAELGSLVPFDAASTGGVRVATGEFNGDGIPDILAGTGPGQPPRVVVLDGTDGRTLADFFGIDDPNFRGGARAAVGDINGDGTGDLVVAAGFGGGPRVAAYDGKQLGPNGGPKLFADFFAFEPSLRNGVYLAAGDVNGDNFADVVAGAGPGGGPRVFILDGKSLSQNGSGTLVPRGNYFAGDPTNRDGVTVAVKNLDDDDKADVVTGAGAGSRVTAYLGSKTTPFGGTPAAALDFDAFAGYGGGVFVG